VFNMKVTLIGIDLAKNIFQVAGVNQAGKVVFNKHVKRRRLMALLLNYPEAQIAMEACGGSNFWGRELKKRGYTTLLIPPIHVKPFVKGNKNDRNDAVAITEAARRPEMTFVNPRGLEQTDLIQLHRVKDRRTTARTALINQIRGFLSEYGLTVSSRTLLAELQQEWLGLNRIIASVDEKIKIQSIENEDACRLMQLKGVGSIIATAFVAAVGDGSSYKNGRHCSANLGLVPKEHSSGGKQKLGGITKRGNNYLRSMIIQGAWSVLRYVDKSDDNLSRWAKQVMARRGKQKAVVAVANKMTRIMWAMLNKKTNYIENLAQ
jgi:transposase